jgi:hypothetical protein
MERLVNLVYGHPLKSSSKDRLEQAKRDWKDRKFPKVPGDEVEFTPLPE